MEPFDAAGAPLSPAEQASKEAQATGQRVEVVAERAEDELVYANPDGSFTSEITAGPQRVERTDGSWADIDPTLVRRPDGSVGPRAAVVDLSFSGGGSTDLVSLGDEGASMSLGWQGKLPAPTLAGPVATYADVLPGVDLKMRASSVGYSYVMVVKNAEAAANPELTKLRLAVKAEGVRMRQNADGGLAAVDDSGATRFEGVQPTMWDSAGGSSAPAPGFAASTTPVGGPAPAPADPAAGPSAGDQVADVDLAVSASSLTLVPDADLLRSPDTVYPVYIDPDATIKKTDWVYVSSDHPSTEYHNFDDDEGVGRCSNWGGYLCSSDPYTNRMYFKFTPKATDWDERVVTKAGFRAYETWSFSCTASWINLNLVDAAKVGSGTNWNNKPADGDLMVDRKVAYGRGKSCDPDAPASWVEFFDNKEETNENLTPTVRAKLASGAPIAFSLNAKDEGDGNSWKRFKGSNASLVVTYNTRPGKPYNERTVDPAMSCVTGANRPFLWNDPPTMVTNATDPDSQNISVTSYLHDSSVSGNPIVQTTKVGPKAHTDGSGKAVDFKAPVTVKLTHGHLYKWHARSNDGSYDSVSYSDVCEFSTDFERPNATPAVSSTDFPTDSAVKKPGEPGTVTFSANGVDDSVYHNDVAYYEWAIGNDNPTNKAIPDAVGGDADATVSAATFGPNVLYARSVDRAGNRGELSRYVFRALRPCDDPATDSCAAAVYPLDETTGTTAADTSGKGRTLTLSGTDRVDGQQASAEPGDRALRFAGGADFATATPAVDTRQGFTALAWVRPSSLSADATVLSQVGTYGNGFALSYSAAAQRWVFSRNTADKATPTAADVVVATARTIDPPVAGRWTQIAATFNPATNRMAIFVDGEEVGTASYTGSVWNAAAGLQLGRAKTNGAWTGYFAGDIDDVRVFPGALDTGDLTRLWRDSRPETN